MKPDLAIRDIVGIPKEKKCPICGTAMVEKEFDVPWAGIKIRPFILVCDCLKREGARKAMVQLYVNANMPKKFYAEGMTDWIKTPGTEDLERVTRDYVADLLANIHAGKGILFGGPKGTGKTKCAAFILNEAIKKGVPAYYISSDQLTTRIPTLKKDRRGHGLGDFLRKITHIPLLVYDDVGESDPNSWDEKEANLLVNERYNQKKATLFTSMKPIDVLFQQVGDHMVSRIIEMSGQYIAEVDAEAPDMRDPENRKKYGLKVLF